MPRLSPQIPSNLSNAGTLGKETRIALENIRDQNNRSPSILNGFPGQKFSAKGLKQGDTLIGTNSRGVTITVGDGKGGTQPVKIPRDINHYQSLQEGTGAPTTDNFPDNQDFGWYLDTSVSPTAAYYVINVEGTIYTISPSTIGITFSTISGTISNDQHGALGRKITAGTPHHTNATTSEPGFMSTTHFDLVNGATASATASTLAKRDGSGGISFGGTVTVAAISGTGNIATSGGNVTGLIADMTTSYKVNGTQVVSARNTGWTAQTASPSKADLGATPSLGQLASWASAIQSMLSGHGLIN